jgi:hypothetical protein
MPMPSSLVSPRFAPGGLLGPQVVVADQLERPVERGLVVAGVEDQARSAAVGELVGLDVVAAADLVGADAHGPGEGLHGPLDGEGGLGPAGAAVGVGRGHGGEHAGAGERVRRDVVDAVVEEGAEQRDAGGDQLQVRPHVGEQLHPDRGDLAVGVGGQLDVLDLAPALDGGGRPLGAALGPSGGHTQLLGHREGDELLGVDVELGAEATAHRRRDDPDLVLGRAGGGGQHHLEDVGDLGGGVDGDLTGVGLGHHGHAPGLHGRGDEALLHVALRHDVRRLGEGALHRVGVGDQLPRVGGVGAEGLVDHDPVAHRVLQVDHRRQRVVVDHHGLEGVGHRSAALAHHHRHDVAGVAGLVERDREVLGVAHVLGDRPRARHGGGPVVAQVGAGEHGLDPGPGQRLRGVDGADAGVGERAADHAEPAGAGDHEVVDVAALAGEELRVLLAHHPGADDRAHRLAPGAAAITALTMLW